MVAPIVTGELARTNQPLPRSRVGARLEASRGGRKQPIRDWRLRAVAGVEEHVSHGCPCPGVRVLCKQQTRS